MKYKFLRMSLLCAFAFLFGGVALGALMANEGTKLIDFPSTDTGITANGTTTKGTVSELTVFTLKNGYTGNNAGNNIRKPAGNQANTGANDNSGDIGGINIPIFLQKKSSK